jgi:hypothetical protein
MWYRGDLNIHSWRGEKIEAARFQDTFSSTARPRHFSATLRAPAAGAHDDEDKLGFSCSSWAGAFLRSCSTFARFGAVAAAGRTR